MLKIKELRELKGFTQEEVADFIDVSKRTYINYEQFKTDIPFTKLQNIATFLNMNIVEIIDYSSKTKSTEKTNKKKVSKKVSKNTEKQKVQKKLTFTETPPKILEQLLLLQQETISDKKHIIELQQENVKLNQEKAQLRQENERLRATIKDDKENTKENKEAV